METQEKDRDLRTVRNEKPEKPENTPKENPKENPPPTSRIDHDDPVEVASDESFPASDPPGSY
jgi:hypothetical protein